MSCLLEGTVPDAAPSEAKGRISSSANSENDPLEVQT